jgi:stage V sporulation protein D (sporulation-specific penicillin-binding protein)
MVDAPHSMDPIQYRCVRGFRVAIGFLLAIVAARLVGIQVLAHEEHLKTAIDMVQRTRVLAAQRGALCDRKGRELAVDRPALIVYVRPDKLVDPWQTAVDLGGALKREPGELAAEISRSPNSMIRVAEEADPSVADDLRGALQRERVGICLETIQKRVYPQGSVAADLLGFVGREHTGLAGLEHSLEHRLQGQEGLAIGQVDVNGVPLEHRTETVREPKDGETVFLTIDSEVQTACEKKLAEAVRACGAQGGCAIVMHAPTGRVLVACDVPTYDLTRHRSGDETETWRPDFSTWTYEPGSTIKPLVFAMALEQGVIRSNETFFCDGVHKVADRTLRCHGPEGGHGTLGVSGVLRVSCNDATAQVGERAGSKRLSALFTSLGFTGSPTDEIQSQYQNLPSYLGPTWCATSAYGQGISITPLHLTTAFAALANGGMLVRPEFVEATAGPDGRKVEREPAKGRRVFRQEIADVICRDLIETVEAKDGTGHSAAIKGLSIAGKTGTAQIPAPTGGYLDGVYVVSFVGILPADHPEWVVTVVINRPTKGNAWGGTIAAPAFREIALTLCRALAIPIDRT